MPHEPAVIASSPSTGLLRTLPIDRERQLATIVK
jgi:hypothetical protein